MGHRKKLIPVGNKDCYPPRGIYFERIAMMIFP